MERAQYHPVENVPVNPQGCYVAADLNPQRVKVDSPAVLVMTDLSRLPAATIGITASLAQANQSMIHRGVRMLLVTDANRRLVGIITTTDLLGERPVLASLTSGMKRDDLRISDVMTPIEAVDAMPLEKVLRSEVGHIVATLKQSGRQHAIVVSKEGERHEVRGVFSVTQIARQLGVPITGNEMAHNFAEIEAAIACL